MSFSEQLWATLQAGMPVFLWLIISEHLSCRNRRAYSILILAIFTIWLWQFQRLVFALDPSASSFLPLVDSLIVFSALLLLRSIWRFDLKCQENAKKRVPVATPLSLGCVLFLCLLGMLFSKDWWLMGFVVTPEKITWNASYFSQVFFWCAQLLAIAIYAIVYWIIRRNYRQQIVRIVRLLVIFMGAELLTQLYEVVLLFPSIDGTWRADWAIAYESNPWHWWVPFLEHFGGFRLQSDWAHTLGLFLYYSVVTWMYMPRRKRTTSKSRRRVY